MRPGARYENLRVIRSQAQHGRAEWIAGIAAQLGAVGPVGGGEEILGKHCSIIFGGESGDGLTFLQQSVEDGKPRSNKRLFLMTKAGLSVPIQANCMALRSDQGRIIGGLATIQDLSLEEETTA